MHNTEPTYILATNRAAMILYKESKETLMKSNNYDFNVFRFSNWDTILKELEEWEDYITIDESTHYMLHSNLCKKLRAHMKYV